MNSYTDNYQRAVWSLWEAGLDQHDINDVLSSDPSVNRTDPFSVQSPDNRPSKPVTELLLVRKAYR